MNLTLTKPQAVIKSAVKKYVEFIASTYGPAGKKILIVRNEFAHEAVDDGKRSSQAFEIEDEFENAVIQYIKETTQKGKDGTTTAGLIMGNIILEAFEKCSDPVFGNQDYHGMALSIKKGLKEAVQQITKAAKKIKTKDELYAIAHNSYNNPQVAELIAETIFKIGKDGVLSIEDSRGTDTTVDIVTGLEIAKGYQSPYFINTKEQDRVVLENPAIIVINKKINLFAEIVPLIQTIVNQKKFAVTIIADGFSDDVVNRLIAYKFTNQLQPLLIEAPGHSDKIEHLSDIAVVTGATLIDDKTYKLAEFKDTWIGTCGTIKAFKDKTVILDGCGKTKEYITTLKNELEKSTNEFEKDRLTKRIAAVQGGIAVIKVGAYTENEQKSIKAKVENAVNSTQIAYKGGVVDGAGRSLSDITTTSELLNKALKAPRLQLEKNGAEYLDKDTVDPADILITALESAVSIASGLLTMGGIVVPKRKKDKNDEPVF